MNIKHEILQNTPYLKRRLIKEGVPMAVLCKELEVPRNCLFHQIRGPKFTDAERAIIAKNAGRKGKVISKWLKNAVH